MKAGVVVGLHVLAELGTDVPLSLLVTGDEEVGSPASRRLVEQVARRCLACLVLEGAGPGGAVKSARRGWSFYTVELHGVAAHAGLEPDAGVNVLHGGPNRPPMEADAALRQLANLTAAVGVPTLDGLGAVGGGPHAEHEWIDLAGTRERVPTLAALVRDLLDDPLTDPEPTEAR